MNVKLTAHLAGLCYVALIPLGIMAMMYVPSSMVVEGDIAATIQNIRDHEMMFRMASVSVYLVQIVNLVLVYFLYRILRTVNHLIAVSMVLLISLGVPIAWINELNYAAILMSLDNPARVEFYLELHTYGLQIAGIFWGFWLIPMGYLVFRSTFMPKWIGILLMIGSIGYLFDSFAYFINPDLGFELAVFLFVGEMAMAFWLLIMGVKVKEWEAQVALSA